MSEWKKYCLEDLAFYYNGKAFKPSDWEKEGVKIIRIEQLNNPDGFYDFYQGEFPEINNIENGDLIFSWSATLKVVIWKHGNSVLNQHLFKVVPKYITDKLFLFFLLDYNMEKIGDTSHGSTMKHIKRGELKKYFVNIPEIPEQRRISRILTTADSVIEKTQAAIAKYKAIKQGMLHDLFTRGIDSTTGKLRPKYEDAPELYKESKLGIVPKEWEVLTVADVSENLDGRRIPVKQEDRDKQAKFYRYYGASGVIDYVEDFLFDEPLILLGEDGENVISRNLPLAFKVEGKIWVNNHAHVLKAINTVTTIDFLCEALESVDYSPIVSGSAQPKITQGHLSKILLRIPKIEEQEIISKRIVTLNNKLHTEQTYLHKLHQLKAGLMGDLLSGRKRVHVEILNS
jgi:type I restriction enzyme S subunit